MLKLGERWEKKFCQHQVKEGPCSQHLLLLLRILKTQWSVSPAQPWASCPVSRDSSVNTCWKKRIVGFLFLVDSLSQCPWKRLIFLFKKKKKKKLISLFSWLWGDLLFHLPCQWEFSFTARNFKITERPWGSGPFAPHALLTQIQASLLFGFYIFPFAVPKRPQL